MIFIVKKSINGSFFFFCSDLVAELPFTLMHPKPLEDYDRPSSSSGSHKSESSINTKENGESSTGKSASTGGTGGEQKIVEDLVDTNLIQLDTETTACYADQDDDIIFEDFARLRLKGETDAWKAWKIANNEEKKQKTRKDDEKKSLKWGWKIIIIIPKNQKNSAKKQT